MYLCNVRQGQTLAHTTSLGLTKFNSNLYRNGNNNKDFQRKEVHFELPEGYVADITLRVHTSFYNDRGDYFTPPESSGTHSWEVTHLDIWDAEGELAEELNELGYMDGEYEW